MAPQLIIVQPCPKLPGDAEFSLWPLRQVTESRPQTELLVGNEGFCPLRRAHVGGPVLGF